MYRLNINTICNIKADRIAFFSPKFNDNVRDESKKNLQHNKTTGFISESSKKLLCDYTGQFLESIKTKNKGIINNKVTFITLTLPAKQRHTDIEIKENFLNRFIVYIKKMKGVKNYIWKAEKQKNGNLHFHILTDKFIEWRVIRNEWNKILKDYGYIKEYSDKRIYNYKFELQLLKSFMPGAWISKKIYLIENLILSKKFDKWAILDKMNFINYLKNLKHDTTFKYLIDRIETDKKNNFSSPNSTDIANIRKVKNLIKYICKEVCKSKKEFIKKYGDNDYLIKKLQVDGKLWDCSENIQKLKFLQVDFCDSHNEINDILLSAEQDIKTYFLKTDFCNVVYTDVFKHIYNNSKEIKKGYLNLQIDNYKKLYP